VIYGGEKPDSPLVGVAFVYFGGSTPPEAYAGGNDWWHLHSQVCSGLDLQKYPDPDSLSGEECTALGGRFVKLFPASDGQGTGGVWLLHAWLFQSYEYRPDLFVSGHPCMLADAVAPQSDPCWVTARRDPALGPSGPRALGHHSAARRTRRPRSLSRPQTLRPERKALCASERGVHKSGHIASATVSSPVGMKESSHPKPPAVAVMPPVSAV
jgi:hypothetical protein